MKILKKALILGLSLLVLVGCSSGNEEDKTLVVYSPNSEGIMNAVIPLFEEKTGISVEIISAGTGELIKRIEAEADNPYGDVLFGGTYTQFVDNADLFQEYVSVENDNVIEEYQNKDGYITFTVLDGSVLIVNKELTEGITIESYEDLLQPELKGKIASADAANSSSAFAQLTNILLANSENGDYMSNTSWEYVDKLIEQLDGKVQSGSSAVYKSVVDGEMWVGLTYEDPVSSLIKDGATNVDIVYPKEGSVFLPAGSAIIKDAKHLENAQLFIDFLLSEEVQDIFGTELTNRPVRKNAKVGSHLTEYESIPVIYEDMDYVSKNKSQIVERYTTLFAEKQ